MPRKSGKRMQHEKPFKLMRRKTLSDAAIMRQWQSFTSCWTPEEAEAKKIAMEAKGWEVRIVGVR